MFKTIKQKTKKKQQKLLNFELNFFNLNVNVVPYSSTSTLSVTSLGLIGDTVTVGVGCGLTLGNEVPHGLVSSIFNSEEKNSSREHNKLLTFLVSCIENVYNQENLI